ncbi:MAG: hypothetical protein WCY72_08915 [Lysobacteraceae bacterium]|jgi:hypothetical protein
MNKIENVFSVGNIEDPKSLIIGYSKGYKYQLEFTKAFWTPIKEYSVKFDWYELYLNGLLVIQKGYAWDGMTGWIDTVSNRVYSLVHDVFCQMMRNNQIPHIYKEVNAFCYDLGTACEMSLLHAGIVTLAVNANKSGDPGRGPDRPVLYAPSGKLIP